MERSVTKLRDLATLLGKKNNILISEAIGLLREEQPFEGAIGLLTSFYDGTDDYPTRKSVEGFMNDLKDQSATVEVINEIRKKWKAGTISMLVSSCWQSGLDYSDFSLDFARIFLEGDYVTAIECLTVIEESVHKLNPDRKEEIKKLIGENNPPSKNEKSTLSSELLAILDK